MKIEQLKKSLIPCSLPSHCDITVRPTGRRVAGGEGGGLPVIVLDAVGVVVVIGDERRPLQYARAGATAEAMSMETLAHRLQHTVGDLLPTSGTNRQGTLKRSRRNGRRDQAGRNPTRCTKKPKYRIRACQGRSSVHVSPHHVAVLTLGGAVPVVELHALQGALAAHTTETVGVEEFVHGSNSRLRT